MGEVLKFCQRETSISPRFFSRSFFLRRSLLLETLIEFTMCKLILIKEKKIKPTDVSQN